MDKPLAYLQLVLGISALTFVILLLFRLFTQVSFDQEPGSNYAYYFISFTISLIAFVFSVAYVTAGVTAVVLFKLAPYGPRYVAGLLKAMLFNSIAVPCLFAQLVLSLIGLFYYVTTSVMHNRDQQLKQTRLYFCVAGFGLNLVYCGSVGGLSVRLIRKAYHMCAIVANGNGYELRPLGPDQQQQQIHQDHRLPPPQVSPVAPGGGRVNGDILVALDGYD